MRAVEELDFSFAGLAPLFSSSSHNVRVARSTDGSAFWHIQVLAEEIDRED
jgi:hypothetical protein